MAAAVGIARTIMRTSRPRSVQTEYRSQRYCVARLTRWPRVELTFSSGVAGRTRISLPVHCAAQTPSQGAVIEMKMPKPEPDSSLLLAYSTGSALLVDVTSSIE